MFGLQSANHASAPTRRDVLRTAAVGSVAAGGAAMMIGTGASGQETTLDTALPPEDYRVEYGRIRQSVMAWCFDPMPMETLIPACAKMGLVAMEGIDAKYYPLMKEHGLGVSLCSSHGFARGPVNPAHHSFCIEKLREGIELAVQWSAPGVITFTGMREPGITDEEATANCIACWKQVIGYAEEKGIDLVLEHLNSRDDTHPMKGHPGYFGDDVDQCVELIRLVDSPRMKLLFDVYHVQIMNGDVIRRIREYKDVIGHYHTAGVPGRGELDDTQELNYPPIMRAILETGYTGYVAQEFIPTWEDKLASLRHGVRVCDD
jgi:hydroxypyruvate isomerase